MNKILDARNEKHIQRAFDIIPARLHRHLAHVDWLIGHDAFALGLHQYEKTGDGRLFKDTAHCAYECSSADKRTTIVLPNLELVSTIVHELGHVLHESTGWANPAYYKINKVSEYASTDVYEHFAEAFTTFCLPSYWNAKTPLNDAGLDFFRSLR